MCIRDSLDGKVMLAAAEIVDPLVVVAVFVFLRRTVMFANELRDVRGRFFDNCGHFRGLGLDTTSQCARNRFNFQDFCLIFAKF